MNQPNASTGTPQEGRGASKLLLGTSGALAVVVGTGGLLTFIGSLLNLYHARENAVISQIDNRYNAAIERLIGDDDASKRRIVGRAELQDIAARSDFYDDLVSSILANELLAVQSPPFAIAGPPALATPSLPGAALGETPSAGTAEEISDDAGGAEFNPEVRQILDILAARKQRADPVAINLSGINLSEQNLAGTDLSGETLRSADLEGAQLTNANLAEAQLAGSNLIAADLSGANVNGADLTEVDLSGADVSGADLTGATLTGADLRQVKNLTQEQLDSAIVDQTTLLPPGLLVQD
jgi:hypothetical protein